MSGLRLEDFSGAIGEAWEVDAGGVAVPLRLTVAQALPRAMREEGGFRLEWAGPADRQLPQATYSFSPRAGAGGAFEMFIVPIARRGDEIAYEAVFA